MQHLIETTLTAKTTAKVCIIQISDPHITEDGATFLNDYDTKASLVRITDQIKKNEQAADLILLTGDLVQQPTAAAYQKLTSCLQDLPIPLYCLSGNHDDPNLVTAFMGGVRLVKIANWLVILLNSYQAGEPSGYLSDRELEFLQTSLNDHPDHDCLIALHHHPIPINSAWMDAMGLLNQAAFFKIIDQFAQVKGIIWGHIHQQFETRYQQIKLFGTPSTCLQFKPNQANFALDDKPPAYRRLHLFKDGCIETDVIYLPA